MAEKLEVVTAQVDSTRKMMNMSLHPPGLNKVEWSMVVPKPKENSTAQKKDPPPPPPYSYRKDTL